MENQARQSRNRRDDAKHIEQTRSKLTGYQNIATRIYFNASPPNS